MVRRQGLNAINASILLFTVYVSVLLPGAWAAVGCVAALRRRVVVRGVAASSSLHGGTIPP